MTDTTTDLIERLKRKDEEALKEVMSVYKNGVFRYLSLMLGDRDLAEELTQDTFVKVYFKAGMIRTENLKAWIYTIATNLARSSLRRKKIRYLLHIEDVPEKEYSHDPAPDKEIAVQILLADLPEKYRTAVIMKDIDGFSIEEMADMLKKPAGTVKSLIFRGRQQLKQQLIPEQGGVNG